MPQAAPRRRLAPVAAALPVRERRRRQTARSTRAVEGRPAQLPLRSQRRRGTAVLPEAHHRPRTGHRLPRCLTGRHACPPGRLRRLGLRLPPGRKVEEDRFAAGHSQPGRRGAAADPAQRRVLGLCRPTQVSLRAGGMAAMNPGSPPSQLRRRSRRSIKRSIVVTAAALGVFATSAADGGHASGLPTLTCSARTLQVRIADPGPADQSLWGQLCYLGRQEPGTVQLLVHGATYNHLYWDFPYGGGYYSYVGAATAAGYATFDVDRIGDGNSSHPPSAGLDLNAGAVALHDAVTALRSGAVDGHAFPQVIMVGHSIGSMEAWLPGAPDHHADAVIATGVLHEYSPNIGALESILYPAAGDPKFAGSGLDTGYLTTQPGT